jgi:hypothetical protein
MRKNLVAEHAEILHRMVEEAGAAALGLWNDSRRLAYANVNRSGWSNLIIDSFDITEAYMPDKFAQLSPIDQASRAPRTDAQNMLGMWVSNDFQIELGSEKPYTDAILRAKHALLAPLFLDFALQRAGSGVDLANRATFTQFLQKSMPLPMEDEEPAVRDGRAAFLQELQAFVGAKVPDLRISMEDVISLYRNNDGNPVDSFALAE